MNCNIERSSRKGETQLTTPAPLSSCDSKFCSLTQAGRKTECHLMMWRMAAPAPAPAPASQT